MNQIDYKDFLSDYAKELIEMTKSETLYSNQDPFEMGYRSALYAALNVLECQLRAWNIDPSSVGFQGFSAEEWKSKGAAYWGGD